MCDTLVVVDRERGVTLFAKNSDRHPNEAQRIVWSPAREHPRGSEVRCTWIAIPQVARTHAVTLSQPFWMWGAEMGANEHGVVIGNEAVFTRHRVPARGLLGMDLVRLGLERADSAAGAVAVITDLNDRYGQGGGCGYEDLGFRYHSSFLVADASGAFVIETAGRACAVEEVGAGVRTISNRLSIQPFGVRHSDPVRTAISRGRARAARTRELARSARTPGDLVAVLRDHGAGRRWPAYSRLNGCMDSPCMHAGGLVTAFQTVGSWVAELSPRGARHWVTGTASPCLGLFKPISITEPLDLGPAPTGAADPRTLWWQFERIHRAALADPDHPAVGRGLAERDALQARLLEPGIEPGEGFEMARRWRTGWARSLAAAVLVDRRPGWVRRLWRDRDRVARL